MKWLLPPKRKIAPTCSCFAGCQSKFSPHAIPIQAGIMPMEIRIRGILNWPTKRENTLQHIIWPLLWDVYKL